MYKVTISGIEIGYISNKEEFEKLVNEKILNPEEVNIAYVDIKEMPQYEFSLVQNNIKTNEQEIFDKIKEEAVVTYKMYAVSLNNENTTYVNTKEEAEEIINTIKEENKKKLEEIDISMQEIYTQNKEEILNIVEVASAINETETRLTEIVKEQERIKSATFNGVYFSVKPVSGTITSRYGASEDIRDHAHSGLDIAAPNGTEIKVAADGKVTHSGVMGGYGNLIIITHDNGVQTYYAHCSKLYAKVGDEVQAGDVIAAVGSTGESTGNHLHFEIRLNGSTINPQKYLYK